MHRCKQIKPKKLRNKHAGQKSKSDQSSSDEFDIGHCPIKVKVTA